MKKILVTLVVLAGITATAQVKVGTNPTTLATDANFQVEGTTTAEQFTILKNGNVGIGATTAPWPLTISGASASVSVNRFGGVPHMINRHANGTQTAPTATAANDLISRISTWAYDGTQYLANAYIDAIAKNNVTTTTRATDLAFNVANSTDVNEVMRISGSNAFVGIGTTAPAEKLQVAGRVLFGGHTSYIGGFTSTEIGASVGGGFNWLSGNDSGGTLYLQSLASTPSFINFGSSGTLGSILTEPTLSNALEIVSSNGLGFDASGNTAGSSDMFITTTGNVGIGTNAPAFKLDVTGKARASKLIVGDNELGLSATMEVSNVANSNIATWRTLNGGNNPIFSINTNDSGIKLNSDGSVLGNMIFQTGAIDRMTIAANGNVGIGTAAPSEQLEVAKTALFGTANAFGEHAFRWKHNASAETWFMSSGKTGVSTTSTTIGTVSSGTLFQIESNGNVGIGVPTSAATKLDIYVTAAGHILRVRNNTNAFSAMLGTNATAAYLNADNTALAFNLNSTEAMRISASTLNVGIGTNDPKSKLHVVGLPVHADNAAAITAGLTAGAFYHAGDGIVRVVF